MTAPDMTLQMLSPQAAHRLCAEGAILIDIRSAAEHASEHIEHALHIPLGQLARGPVPAGGTVALIFHCRSGRRTRLNAAALRACAGGNAYLLEGGLDAWKQAGLPTRRAAAGMDVQRQVQIAAGSLVLLGTLLGTAFSPWFYVVPGLVGTGLVLAGLSGFCGLARLLMKMPWNRRTPAA